MENKVYICHYCITYITHSKKDLRKHFLRKNKCECSTLKNYEESKMLSMNKSFIFTFDYNNLLKDDFIYIITNYVDKINYIHKDFYKNKLNNILIVKDQINEEEEKNEDINDEFEKLYFNHEKNKYICNDCFTEYTTKYNLIKHLGNKKNCEYKKKVKNLLNSEKDKLKIQKEKEEKKNQEIEKCILQNINTQNININNNNNTQNNMYNLSLKDFVNDNYDLSHIKDDFYEKKDFFLYHNFLRIIMENKKNQNIFFCENEAIIYSDNELNKMSSDKAGYLILDKLNQSFTQLLNKQSNEIKEYYSFISKYYFVIKGHYKHDTIFKEYDVDDRKFIYTASSNMFRSRDKYLNKMVTTLSQFRNSTRENMAINLDEIKNIPIMNPSIEDFASIKMRYRDLRDRD